MSPDVLITALVAAVRKRRILGGGAADRLGELARQKGATDPAALRRWIAGGDGLTAPLAGRLHTLLPAEGEAPYGPYVAIAHLAEGGMGSVWLAAAPDDRLVVVKTLKKSAAAQPGSTTATEFLRRFEREARITMQLDHPSVVRCLDTGMRPDGTAFMVLEYVDSGDLKDLVEARSGLGEGLALAILHQVVDGLDAAHRLKLVHRDIKPANIFVASTGRAKLADFGIARSTEDSRTMLTMEGAVVGSPLYMSPEQILSDPQLDIRSDLYALGAVLYYMLAAQPPFDGRIQEVLHKHCTATVPDVRVLRPTVGERTHRIIMGCLAKERDRRFREPAELLTALADALVRLGLDPNAPLEEDTRPGDLSDSEAGFRPAPAAGSDLLATAVADLGGSEATMAVDLSNGSAGATMATRVQDAHTIVADLLGRPDSGSAEDLQATLAMTAIANPGPGLDGALGAAMEGDWLCLRPLAPRDPTRVVLWARERLVLGKLREPPADLCVRAHPIAQHKDALMRISRQHLALDLAGGPALVDLGAANGTEVDGLPLAAQGRAPLDPERETIAVLAGAATLWFRPVPRRAPVVRSLPGAPTSPGGMCGIDHDAAWDAVVLRRPDNRPEMAYALVPRRLTIGGPGAELALANARGPGGIEIGRYAGRWIWRKAGAPAPWRPLVEGQVVEAGGRELSAHPGAWTDFEDPA
jgi:serine/threonine protein kinase